MLALASMVGHWLLPAIVGGSGEPAVTVPALERLGRIAYRLDALRDTDLEQAGPPAPPPVPSLWNPAALAQVFPATPPDCFSINPAVLTPEARRRPVWLVVRSANPARVLASAVADHRVSPSGEPLFYRLADSMSRVVATPLLDFASDLLVPRCAGTTGWSREMGPGCRSTAGPGALLLAWALQAGELLGDLPSGSRVDWRLSPEERLGRLAPFADWGAPTARIIDGELVWLVDGYLTSRTFPLTHRVTWRERKVGSVGAAFLGTVNAESGDARVYLQPGADALADTWSRVSDGVVEPASAIPESVLRPRPIPLISSGSGPAARARALESRQIGSVRYRECPSSAAPDGLGRRHLRADAGQHLRVHRLSGDSARC